jgi:hypothetical protein
VRSLQGGSGAQKWCAAAEGPQPHRGLQSVQELTKTRVQRWPRVLNFGMKIEAIDASFYRGFDLKS